MQEICSCENDKYLASIVVDDSEITCDEIIDTTKTVSTNFDEKKALRIYIYIIYIYILLTSFFSLSYHIIIDSC